MTTWGSQLRRVCTIARSFDHFALFAPFYDRVFGSMDSTRLQELLGLPTEGRLLDAGGGTGRVAQALVGLTGQVVVTDLSLPMLRQAMGKSGLELVCAHAERLPFRGGSFDRILVVDAFHHFCDQHQAVADLWRVLALGGRLVVEEPNIETWTVKLVALGERLALMRSRFYSPRDMRHMFEMLGGQVEVYADHAFNTWVVVEKKGEAIVYCAIGYVENEFDEPAAPETLRAVESRIVLDPSLTEGLTGLEPGQQVMVVFHLHRSRGYRLRQHPRGDRGRPERGVFALRSPCRPNPIGVTVVDLVAVEENVLRVRGLDAINGTPVLDLKPA